MFISDIEVGSIITIEVKVTGKLPTSFTSEVLNTSSKGKCILVQPIMSEDKVIAFDAQNMFIEVILLIDGKPMVWTGCGIQYLKFQGQYYHAIVCKNSGVNQNRRRNFRVPVDEYCYVNHGKATVDALLVDISSTGFCFVVGKYDGPDMSQVIVTYNDSLVKVEIVLQGRVVRKVVEDDGKTTFGCIMMQRSDVDRYINERQRKLISLKKSE